MKQPARWILGLVAAGLVAAVLGGTGRASAAPLQPRAAESSAAASELSLSRFEFHGMRAPDAFGTVPDVGSGESLEIAIRLDRQIRANAPITPAVQEIVLTTSNPQVFPMPAKVRVQAGDDASPARFVVRPATVTQPTPVELTASLGGKTLKLNFRVVPFASVATVYGSAPDRPFRYSKLSGAALKTSVSIDRPAPIGGAKVTIVAASGTFPQPGYGANTSPVTEVTIPAGEQTAPFTVSTEELTRGGNAIGLFASLGAVRPGAPRSGLTPIAQISVHERLSIVNVYRAPVGQYPCPPGRNTMLVEFNADPETVGTTVELVGQGANSPITMPDFVLTEGRIIAEVPFEVRAGVTRAQSVPIKLRLGGPIPWNSEWTDQIDIVPAKFDGLAIGREGEGFASLDRSVQRGRLYTLRLSMTGTVREAVSFELMTTGLPAGALPTSVTVPAGQASVTMPLSIPASQATAGVDAGVRVTLPDGTRSNSMFKVLPAPPPTLEVVEMRVRGGDACTLAIRLATPAPVGGQVLALRSSSALVKPPSEVTIPAGERDALVTVPTDRATAYSSVSISADLVGVAGRPRGSASVWIGPAIRVAIRGGFVELAKGRFGAGETIEGKFVRSDDGPVGWPVSVDVSVYDSALISLSRTGPSAPEDANRSAVRPRVGGKGAAAAAAKLQRDIGAPKSAIRRSATAPGGEAAFRVLAPSNTVASGMAGIKVDDMLAPVELGSSSPAPALDDYADVLVRVIGLRDMALTRGQMPRYGRFFRDALPTDAGPAVELDGAIDTDALEGIRSALKPLRQGGPPPVSPK
ncbi:MAG: hypothetical protein ACKOYN_00930 [Planctomycetota bacterium]